MDRGFHTVTVLWSNLMTIPSGSREVLTVAPLGTLSAICMTCGYLDQDFERLDQGPGPKMGWHADETIRRCFQAPCVALHETGQHVAAYSASPSSKGSGTPVEIIISAPY